LEQRLARLHAEERALEAELKRVQTDLGREALARQRGWLRKGEEPLRINRP
jgi:cell division protein FtsB